MRSLRARVLFGAVLWTIGLVVISFAMLAVVWTHFPELPFLGRAGAVHLWVRHTGALLLVALLCMIAGAFQVRSGLSGLTRLRARLAAVHDGREPRVEGRFASEVQPLVDDLNALLEHRGEAVRRAVAKAGDLAHGLKTPLALLAREAERIGAAGETELAASIDQQVERMRRQIDYHLAHARAAASGAAPGARCAVEEAADALARTLHRLHADRHLAIDIRVSPLHVVRVQREDLDEMLGNLFDNACKWAGTQVVVHSAQTDTDVVISVEDDGEGLRQEMRRAVLQRGVRADERAPGSGLGLAIVHDLAELYGGTIALEDASIGGLRATLTLPRG